MKFLSLNEAISELQDVRDQVTIADIYDHRCERLVSKLSNVTKHILLKVMVGIHVGVRRMFLGPLFGEYIVQLIRFTRLVTKKHIDLV